MRSITAMLLVVISLCSHAQQKTDAFIDLTSLVPDVKVDIRYFGRNNFVGKKVDGYLAPKCIIHRKAAESLLAVQQEFALQGYRLKVFDCYRPMKAVAHFMRWARDLSDIATKANYFPNIAKSDLVPNYIAKRSGHSRGYTVDLTLEYLHADGSYREVDMGSPFDLFDTLSNTDDSRVTDIQRNNRYLLNRVMRNHGFKGYALEWWHFTHNADPKNHYWDFDVK